MAIGGPLGIENGLREKTNRPLALFSSLTHSR